MAATQDIRTVMNRLWQNRRRLRPTLADRLQQEFYRRGWPDRYRTEGQWITIGGAPDGDKEHAGGTPVRIGAGGRITAGPRALEGKRIGQLDRDKPSTRFEPGGSSDSQGTDQAAGGPAQADAKPASAAEKDVSALRASDLKSQFNEAFRQRGLFGSVAPESKPQQKPTPSGEKQRAIDFPEEKPAKGQRAGVKSLPDGRQVGATTVNVSELSVDPNRFQYKVSGIGAGGVNEELKEVKQFRPEFGGQLLVWHDPADGQDYVINGHHRYELASRSPQTETWQGELNVMFIDAKNPKEARAIGALANIAEGRGTALDAAKFMRDSGLSIDDMAKEGVSLKGQVADRGAVLSKLSNTTFRRLIDGMISENRAVAVARDLPGNPDLQDEILKDVDRAEQKGRTVPDHVVAEMAREAALAPTVQEEVNDLFGSSVEQKNLRVPRAEIKSALRREIAAEMSAHKAVTGRGRAERLEQTGSQINVEASQEAAKAAEEEKWIFDKLANSKGVLSDVVNRYAEQLHAAATKRQRDSALKAAARDGRTAIRAALAGGKIAFARALARDPCPSATGRIVRPGRSRIVEMFAAEFGRRGFGSLREMFQREFARRQTFSRQGSLWDESEHPRNEDGEFAEKPGEATKAESADKPQRAAPGSQLSESVKARLASLGMQGTLPPADVPLDAIQFADLDGPEDALRFQPLLWWSQQTKSGRTSRQYRYTQEFHDRNAAEKFTRVKAIEPFRAQIADLLGWRMADERLPARDREAAAIASIITETGLRPTDGSESVKHGHYGAGSLLAQHVSDHGDELHLDFVGKEGVQNHAVVRDPRNVEFLRRAVAGKPAGDPVFSSATSDHAARQLKEVAALAGAPADTQLKDMRTVYATQSARAVVERFQGPPPPLTGDEKKDARAMAKAILKMSGEVATLLNNTPAMARDNYIHPEVWREWQSKLASAA